MRKVLVLFVLIQFGALAQKDTVFHPYYIGVQLIEIKQKEWYPPTKAFVQADVSLVYGSPPPIYLLRNTAGKIIQSFNVPDTVEIEARELSREEAPVFHAIKTKNTSSHIGFSDEGYNMVYPVYNFSEVKKGKAKQLEVGLLDSLGNIVIPIQYDRIEFKDSVFFATKGSKISLYDDRFRWLSNEDFDEVRLDNTIQNLLTVKKNGKFGIIKSNGDWKLLAEHDAITVSKYMNGYYAVKKNNFWGFIKMDLSEVLPIVFPTDAVTRKDTYFSYLNPSNQKYHLTDTMGYVFVETDIPVEQIVNPYRFILMRFQDGYHRYLVDEKNTIIIDDFKEHLWKLSEDRIMAGYHSFKKENGLNYSENWKILDLDGHAISDKEYRSFEKIDAHFVRLWDRDNKLWVCDFNGMPILDFSVDQAYKYDEHFYMYKVGDKYFFTDFHQPQKSSKAYETIQCYKSGFMAVSNDKKWTFIGKSFKEIAPMEATSVQCFNEGVAIINLTVAGEKQVYLMDSLGRLQPQWYKAATIYKGGYVWVVMPNGNAGLWDIKGAWLIRPEYDSFTFVVEQKGKIYVGAQKGKKYFLLDKNGVLLSDLAFDKLVEISVHASIPQRRMDGYFALSIRNFRTQIEYIYFNFNPEKNLITRSPNGTMGFEIFESKCNADGPFKCYGVRNWDGKMVIPPVYTQITDYKNGAFKVATPNGGGIIDTTGKILIPVVYKYVYELSGDQGYYQVGRHYGGWGLYKKGQLLADTLYGGFDKPIGNLLPFFSHPNYHYVDGDYVHDEQKRGFMDTTGNIVLAAQFDRYIVKDPKKGILTVVKGNDYYDIDQEGKRIPETAKSIPVQTEPVGTKSKKKRKKKGVRWF